MDDNKSDDGISYLGYQHMKLEAIIDLLFRKGLITKDELAANMFKKIERVTNIEMKDYLQESIKRDFT